MTSPIPAGGDEIGELLRRAEAEIAAQQGDAAAWGVDTYGDLPRYLQLISDLAAALTAANARISALEAQAAASVEQEREACAELAESMDEVIPMWERPGGPPGNGPKRKAFPNEIAAAIRSRSSNGGQG